MFAYVTPARIARSSDARSPAVKPCAVGPTTSAAVIVPDTDPDEFGGQAGLPPPPQKNTATPPFTPGWPTWMWATSGGAERFAYVSLNLIWSRVIVARRTPRPCVFTDGTSWKPLKFALSRIALVSAEALVGAPAANKTPAPIAALVSKPASINRARRLSINISILYFRESLFLPLGTHRLVAELCLRAAPLPLGPRCDDSRFELQHVPRTRLPHSYTHDLASQGFAPRRPGARRRTPGWGQPTEGEGD
jgi:hypothetical protein